MKSVSLTLASVFVGALLGLSAPYAFASGGGDGGGGGGRDPAAPSNPEEKQAPSGFATHSPRAFSVKPSQLTPAEIEALRAQGFVSESEQRDSATRNWNERASAKSQAQWEKHQATAYDVTAGQGGVSLVDAVAMSAAQPTAQVSSALANQAWTLASQQARSVGVVGTVGLGGAFRPDAGFDAARSAAALPNQSVR